MNDVIDIGLENFDINKNGGGSTSGGGLEFLMNTGSKMSDTPRQSHMNLGDLNQLENELNDLSNGRSVPLETVDIGLGASSSNVGAASADYYSQSNTKTWDGYTKMNDVPLETLQTPKVSDREKSKKKRIMLKRLEEWQKKGHIQNSGYNMDSSYEDIEDEYETVMEDRRKQESIKLQKHWFVTGINTIEFFNSMFNPFDLDLTGWGEKMAEDVDDDDEIFAELYEKYKGGKLAPEVSLLLRVATSAFLINMTNKMVSSATPGLSDIFRQSPDLMNSFMKATVDSLNQAGPGGGGGKQHPLASFAQDMFSKDFKPSTMQGPPPAPVETKVSKTQIPGPPKAGASMQYTSRPDLQHARGGGGIEINQGFSPLRESKPMMTEPISNFSAPPRQEMRGPSSTDLDSILAGLKRKDTTPVETVREENVDDETVSVISMRDLESTVSGSKAGYKKRGASKRKPKSDKSMNNISIDL